MNNDIPELTDAVARTKRYLVLRVRLKGTPVENLHVINRLLSVLEKLGVPFSASTVDETHPPRRKP